MSMEDNMIKLIILMILPLISYAESYNINKDTYEKCMKDQGCNLESYIRAKNDCSRWSYGKLECENSLKVRYDDCKMTCVYLYGSKIN